jgi:hypothetical protein
LCKVLQKYTRSSKISISFEEFAFSFKIGSSSFSLSSVKSFLTSYFWQFQFFVVSCYVNDGLCIIDFLKIDLGFFSKIQMREKLAYKNLSTNIIPMPWDELDCISPYMVLDVRAFKFSLLGVFCQYF